MSTPDLSTLPANIQDLIKAAVADALHQQELATAPRELTEHEKLVDHVDRAERAANGERTNLDLVTFQFHTISALRALITEVEGLSASQTQTGSTSSGATNTATVGSSATAAPSADTQEGAL